MTWTQRFAPLTRGFHAYARWLVGISWKKFFLLAVLLMICASLLQSLPPFSWLVSDHVSVKRVEKVRLPRVERSDSPIRIELHTHVDAPESAKTGTAPTTTEAAKAEGSSLPSTASVRGEGQIRVEIRRDDRPTIEIKLPASSDTTDALGSVAREIQKAIVEANAPSSLPTAKGPAGSNANASNPNAPSAVKKPGEPGGPEADDDGDASDEDNEGRAVSRIRVHTHSGAPLTDFAFLWIVASIIIKIAYTGQFRAEAQASVANETAEHEQLRRQVAEAQMAAMQAQLEPHFLFNTLASIDHLIQTDPPRASRMQQSLIALLRATMPSLREGKAQVRRTLGEELEVIHPYLDIQKTRMEERLQTTLLVPAGLLSAEFPPMMLQSLVENAIKHGLEPKPEGGRIEIEAQVADGRLLIHVRDTGVGFNANAPQGSGLTNIRERLKHRYGNDASLTIARNEPAGSVVRLALPYRAVDA